jgi:hypothetical protein
MDAIRRWEEQGRGAYRDLPASSNTIMHILACKGKGLVFGSYDPAWGRFDRNNRRTRFTAPAIADYRGIFEKGFKISYDGGTIRFGYKQWGKEPATFSLKDRKLGRDTGTGSLQPVITRSAILTISNWDGTTTPKLGAKALDLEKYEISRSLAISPDQRSFLLGADWYLRLFDTHGNLKWKLPIQGVAWGVNISGDGTKAVAALGDGTIRWYRMSDGKLLFTFFPHNDKKRWVAWTPSGYYMASPGGEALIGYHQNRGRDKAPYFFPVAKFRDTFYRPDIVTRILEAGDEQKAIALADEAQGRKTRPVNVQNIYPPVAAITTPADGDTVSSSEIRIGYAIQNPSGQPVTAVKVLIDGRPVAEARGLKRKKQGTSGTITVTIPKRDCRISLIAENVHAASVPATIHLKWRGLTSAGFVIKPKLYVLSIGVSRYEQAHLKLAYPAKDARDLATVFKKQEGSLYQEVQTKILENPVRDDIMDGLDWLEAEVTAKDVAVLFIAGHGVNDRNGNYHFLPANADPDKLRRTGLNYVIIREVLSNLPGKVLAFVDTCHSGNVMGSARRGGQADIDKVAADLSAAENGVVVFASSTGRQYSLEDTRWNNGAFTKALVEGISGKADLNEDNQISIIELEFYLSERVKKLTHNRQTPTTTKPHTIQDFPVAAR